MSHPTNSTGRDKLASMRAAEERKRKLTKTYGLLAGVLALLLVVVGSMWLVSQQSSPSAGTDNAIKDTSYINVATSIPASTFDKVGAGKATGDFTAINDGQSMSEGGKPRILYVGAEFCPYCAMDRWSLVMALSRFGTFKGLGAQLSSANEGEVSNIPTMTFRKASYESKYIAFKPYETTDREHNQLMKLSGSDESLFTKYSPQGNIPWMDWGGTAWSSTAFNDPSMAGKKGVDIAHLLQGNVSSDTAQMMIGAANIQTAKICQLTHGAPANVCSSSGVTAAKAKL